jgi:hypothetical protein
LQRRDFHLRRWKSFWIRFPTLNLSTLLKTLLETKYRDTRSHTFFSSSSKPELSKWIGNHGFARTFGKNETSSKYLLSFFPFVHLPF